MADPLTTALAKLRAALPTDTAPRLTPDEVRVLLAHIDRLGAIVIDLTPAPNLSAAVQQRMAEFAAMDPDCCEDDPHTEHLDQS